MRGKIAALLVVAGILPFSAALAADGWRSECVGNYQLDLPGEFEYALSDVSALYEANGREGRFFFAGGQKALFSSLSLASGAIAVTPVQSVEAFTQLEQMVDYRIQARQTDDQAGRPVKSSGDGMFAWADADGADLYLERDGHLISYAMPPQHGSMPKQAQRFNGRLQPRAPFEIPAESGLCLPHAFLKGESERSHRVAVTLRLKAYPDVEIFFKEESVGEPSHIKEDEYSEASADEAIESFMTWRYSAYARRAVGDWRGIHPVSLAGRDAKGVFMRIMRKDRTRDYGYLAYAKGRAGKQNEQPNLMLYVFGDAAKAKGLPVSKETLRAIADRIVASVKRRELK